MNHIINDWNIALQSLILRSSVCCESLLWKVYTVIAQFLYILYGGNEWAFYFQNFTTSYEHLVPNAEKALFLRTLLSFWAPWQGGPTMAPPIKCWVNLTSEPVYMLLLYLSCSWENVKTCSCILRIFLWISVSNNALLIDFIILLLFLININQNKDDIWNITKEFLFISIFAFLFIHMWINSIYSST